MDKVLIAGIDSVVGGNLAATIGKSRIVAGVALSTPTTIPGCEIDPIVASTPEALGKVVARVRPQRIVLCGVTAQSGWDESSVPGEGDVSLATACVEAAQKTQAQLTLISSSSVFTGPWMFHSENGGSLCPSPSAQIIRDIETVVSDNCPDALIVRTHAFGWHPGSKAGWIESLLQSLTQSDCAKLNCARHATPILATDLAEIIAQAWDVGLNGIYHAAGAERINPVQFASRLAARFHLPIPLTISMESLIDRPVGFGCGETSLQTRKIRRALGVAMPMLDESLNRLVQQDANGFRNRLSGRPAMPISKVA